MNKKLITVVGIVLSIMITFCACDSSMQETQEDDSIAVTQIVTTISDEEYQFYEECVQKDYKDESGLREKTETFARELYAQYALGEKYNLCKPYSFESLKLDMASENKQRQAKADAGEIIYGPLEYSLDEYLEYTRTNLKIDIIDYLAQKQDKAVEEAAKAYWKENEQSFKVLESVEYSVNGEIKKIVKDEFATLEKTESELFLRLYEGEEGDEFTFSGEETLKMKILKKDYEVVDIETDKQMVLKEYITNVYYPELIKKAMESSLLQFELTQK